jgi:hypothetical protein
VTDYRVWPSTDGPLASVSDGVALNLALQFRFDPGPGWLKAFHFFRGTTLVDGDITTRLWRVDGVGAGTVVPGTGFPFVLSGVGWQTLQLPDPVELDPNFRYKAAVHFPDQFTVTGGYWNGGPGTGNIVNGPLTAYDHGNAIDAQCSFSTGAITNYPTSGNGGNYWVDVSVSDEQPVTSTRRNSFFH